MSRSSFIRESRAVPLILSIALLLGGFAVTILWRAFTGELIGLAMVIIGGVIYYRAGRPRS